MSRFTRACVVVLAGAALVAGLAATRAAGPIQAPPPILSDQLVSDSLVYVEHVAATGAYKPQELGRAAWVLAQKTNIRATGISVPHTGLRVDRERLREDVKNWKRAIGTRLETTAAAAKPAASTSAGSAPASDAPKK